MTSALTQEGLDALKQGKRSEAAHLLSNAVKQDPNDEVAWLGLSACLDDPQKKKFCLLKILQINPQNAIAQRLLADMEKPKSPAPVPQAAAPSIMETQQIIHRDLEEQEMPAAGTVTYAPYQNAYSQAAGSTYEQVEMEVEQADAAETPARSRVARRKKAARTGKPAKTPAQSRRLITGVLLGILLVILAIAAVAVVAFNLGWLDNLLAAFGF
jgi:hypothetical protein